MKNLKTLVSASLMLVLCFGAMAQKQSKEKIAKGYEIGDVATDFLLPNVDGKQVSLASIPNAKGYIVIFTGNVCPFAVMYEDRMIELHNKMAAKGYPVVAINANDPEVEEGDSFVLMQEKSKEKSFPFVYLKDDKYTVYQAFGATKTPHVFLLDKNLTVQYIGAIDDNARVPEEVTERYVENAINALEKGELPDPNFTKAIGCSIKSKNNKGGGRRVGPPSAENILKDLDANGDQKISKSEAQGPLAEDFDSLDKDKDGMLTKDEIKFIKSRGKGRQASKKF